MTLQDITYVGPPAEEDLLARLPADLAGLLRQINGFVQFHGGLHVRGACREPAWHSLHDAWFGEDAYHRLYSEVRPEDVPFGQDCLGDQFLLRDAQVWRLRAETGELEETGTSLNEFLAEVQRDPIETLILQPLLQFLQDGGRLEPGQLLASWPPFCFEQPKGVVFGAVPAQERRRFLADLAAQLRQVPEGGKVDLRLLE